MGFGNRLSEYDQFNRSSMVVPRSASSIESANNVMRLLSNADHEMLLRSGNEAYANAIALHKGTKAEFDSLQYVPNYNPFYSSISLQASI